MELTEKVAALEAKTDQNGKDINALYGFQRNTEKTLGQILQKVNRLLVLDEQSKDNYIGKRLECQAVLDKRYVMQSEFEKGVLDVLTMNRDKELITAKNKISILDNIFNIVFKVASIIGIVYLVVDSLGKYLP